MDDDAIANGPETMGEHERIGKKEEEADPEERRERDERFVGAGVHEEVTRG
jgi:hypothetical protein